MKETKCSSAQLHAGPRLAGLKLLSADSSWVLVVFFLFGRCCAVGWRQQCGAVLQWTLGYHLCWPLDWLGCQCCLQTTRSQVGTSVWLWEVHACVASERAASVVTVPLAGRKKFVLWSNFPLTRVLFYCFLSVATPAQSSFARSFWNNSLCFMLQAVKSELWDHFLFLWSSAGVTIVI